MSGQLSRAIEDSALRRRATKILFVLLALAAVPDRALSQSEAAGPQVQPTLAQPPASESPEAASVPTPPPASSSGTSSNESQFGVANSLDGTPSGTQFFFDARSTGFSKEGLHVYDGDVIAIGPKSLVTADKVTIDEKNRYIVAEGHVIILSNGQYITGDKIELWTDSGNLRVTSALLVVNDSTESEKIAQEILGYSASEVEFEAHRQSRLAEVSSKKDDLRQSARIRTKQGLTVTDDMVRSYARFLEQENLMSTQENPAFAQMSEARRRTLRRRRDFWQQARLGDQVKGSGAKTAYFRLSGETLERTNDNDLTVRDGLFTPCHCEADEDPAWAIRSSNIFAQPGGYGTFKNAILEIKGMPVLYLPWFRIPIKDRRQTGFLPPSFSSDSLSGSVFSQPLFLDLGVDKDVTLKSEIYERRGTRFGFEGRYLRRKHSGFQLNVEIMRDRLWLTQKATREELKDLYLDGLEAARLQAPGSVPTDISGYSGKEYAERIVRQREFWEGKDGNSGFREACVDESDPVKRQQCETELRSQLRAPANSVRGKVRWRGQERLSERISMVTTGDVYSDRRYDSDLYVPESIQAGFDTGMGEQALQPTRLQFHNDQTNYYLGLGSHLGDSVRTNDRFEGYQLPAVVKARSRWFRLGNTGAPIYGATAVDQLRISRYQGDEGDVEASDPYLPSGWWRKFSASIAAPISSRSAVQVDHFTDLEARHISFDRASPKIPDSSIQSLRTGFRFQLPVDGKTAVPGWLGTTDLAEDEGTRYIQHLMNWVVTVSARPSVVRRGPYGDADDVLADRKPNYFMRTDRAGGGDDNIGAEDYMSEYQLISFSTNHRWKIFNELWQRKAPDADPPQKSQASTMSWEEKARRELLYTVDHPVRSDSDMFSQDQTKWFISRYHLLNTDYYEPVAASAGISYDYLKETRRKKDGRTLDNRPWSEAEGAVSVNAFKWTVSDSSYYNIYDRIFTRHGIAVTPPGFFSTNASFTYTLSQKQAPDAENRSATYSPITERGMNIVTSLTAPVYTTYVWGQKEETGVSPQYRQKVSLTYASPSQCWGLGFSREKNYDKLESQASYMLVMSIVFIGQERPFNVGNSLDREINKDNPDRQF